MTTIELFPNEKNTLTDISLVEFPAIEVNFMMFSKQYPIPYHLSTDEKHILTGPALVPDMKIYRREGEKEYEIFFSRDTVKTISQQFLANDKNHSFTLEHSEETGNVVVTESWIVEDSEKDKAAALGFNLPVGTWMLSVKVNDEELWNKIKSGDYKGFSVAGLFRQETEEEKVIREAEEFISQNQD